MVIILLFLILIVLLGGGALVIDFLGAVALMAALLALGLVTVGVIVVVLLDINNAAPWLFPACGEIVGFVGLFSLGVLMIAVTFSSTWQWIRDLLAMNRAARARTLANLLGPIAALLGVFGWALPLIARGLVQQNDDWRDALIVMLAFASVVAVIGAAIVMTIRARRLERLQRSPWGRPLESKLLR